MKEVDLGGEKSFIGAWYIPDLKVCDELIAYFKSSPGKESGQIGHDRQVNKDIKDSLDLIIEPPEFSHPTLRKYVINLMEVTKTIWKIRSRARRQCVGDHREHQPSILPAGCRL